MEQSYIYIGTALLVVGGFVYLRVRSAKKAKRNRTPTPQPHRPRPDDYPHPK